MARRSASKEAFWGSVLKRFESSGLSIREFCRRRGVSEQSFYSWRRRLSSATPSLVRVDVVDSEVAPSASHGGMEIRRDGWALWFDNSVSAARLREVLHVLVDLREE